MPDYTNNPVAKSIRLIGTDVDDKASINHFHDDRYYTESEVDTVSGVLQSQIDDKPNNFLELDDTPTTYGGEQGKYIKVKEDETGLEYIDIVTMSGIDHAQLANLDFASSDHTGFISTATNQTISGTKTFISHVYIKDMEFGTSDAYSRPQIWNYETNSIIRVGSLGSDGDPLNRVSEGIVVYGENVQGDSMVGSDWGFARIKPDRFGLQNSKNGVGQFYYFRIDGSSNEFYLRDDLGNKTFEFDRLTGDLEIVGDVYTDSSYYGNGATLSGIPKKFVELTDTPSTYSGSEGRYLRVKDNEPELEYVTDLNLEIKNSFGSNFLSTKEFTISGSNIVKTEYFDSSGGSRKYFIDYNYNIDDNLTSYIITRDSDLTTQTFTCTYSGGELIKIAAS